MPDTHKPSRTYGPLIQIGAASVLALPSLWAFVSGQAADMPFWGAIPLAIALLVLANVVNTTLFRRKAPIAAVLPPPGGIGFDLARGGMAVVSGAMTVKNANAAFVALLRSGGISCKDAKALFDRPLGQIAPDLTQLRAAPQSGEYRLGEKRVHISLTPFEKPKTDPAGKAEGLWLLEMRDITQSQRDAEIAATVTNLQMRLSLTPEGRIIEASSGFAVLLGESDLVGRDLHSLTEAEDGAKLRAALRAGHPFALPLQIRRTRGAALALSAQFNPRNQTGGWLALLQEGRAPQPPAPAPRIVEQEPALTAQDIAPLLAGLQRMALGERAQDISLPEPFAPLAAAFNLAADWFLESGKTLGAEVEALKTKISEEQRKQQDQALRAEQQADSLQTAQAALQAFTTGHETIASTAAKAEEVVVQTKRGAESSGAVVNDAIAAMGEIEQSSSKISQITSVIEEIAFQTNLLALNAGVEAARAGEAGRGFAFVASEVRALAQRSSAAAREIAGLISQSSDQVKRGVTRVAEAGQSLSGIQANVGDLHHLVLQLAKDTKAQVSDIAGVMRQISARSQSPIATPQALAPRASQMSGSAKAYAPAVKAAATRSLAAQLTTDAPAPRLRQNNKFDVEFDGTTGDGWEDF